MADRYWIASSAGNWNDTDNWSTTSGGSSGAAVPTSSDDVYFDGNGTGDCTLDVNATMLSLTMADAYTGTFDSADYDLTIADDIDIGTGVTWTKGTGTITLAPSADVTVNFEGESIENVEIDASGAIVEWTGTAVMGDLTVTAGTMDAGEQDLECMDLTLAVGARITE